MKRPSKRLVVAIRLESKKKYYVLKELVLHLCGTDERPKNLKKLGAILAKNIITLSGSSRVKK